MFTGIVQGIGQIQAVTPKGGDKTFEIVADCLADYELALGDSVAVSGVCLTVTKLIEKGFATDLSVETLSLTTLGQADAGTAVNIEPALRAGDPLGGHWVSGHVDGKATLQSKEAAARSHEMIIQVPEGLSHYIAAKGSVTLDGVSLTVNSVSGNTFSVNVIPHTFEVTTLGDLAVGEPVNLEVDILARYLERLQAARTPEN